MSAASKLKKAFISALLMVNAVTLTSSGLRTLDAYNGSDGAPVDVTARTAISMAFNSSSKESMDWVNYSMQTPDERQSNPPRNPSEWLASKSGAVWRAMGDENNTSIMNFLPGTVVSIAGIPGDIVGSSAASIYQAAHKPPAPPKS